MGRFQQGIFKPRNPHKYVGSTPIRLRSSWEFTFANFLDTNINIVEWASESVKIPYRHPITGKQTIYVPDFLIRYRDKRNTVITELIEVKPYNQSIVEGKMNAKQRMTVAINHAKWASARTWCKRQKISFRIITERELYNQGKRK